jgi:predicted nuclease with TOPRIM domain
MSVKYETFLQEQINQLEIEVSELKRLVKALIDNTKELDYRLEEIEEIIPLKI